MKKLIAKKIVLNQAKASSKLERKVRAIGAGSRVGIVFNAEEEATRKLMYQFKEKLQPLGVDCTFLGFFDAKDFPAGLSFKPGFDYFNRKDLQWHGLPTKEKVKGFTDIQVDFFIFASLEGSLCLLQLAAASKAFRIGPFMEGYENCFDFMIDVQKQADLGSYLSICEHYLKQLK
ncbi:MAG: hypothetical protein EP332_07145 [Bacteroidetes bacterium]|nr:MAG: hypothetical protein EP332_07145 [Bacteroidota bacterium]